MLKIEIDRAYPHYSLSDCADLLAMLAHVFDSPEIEMPEEARNGAGWTLDAVRQAMGEIVDTINAFMKDDRGYVRPMRAAAKPATPTPAEPADKAPAKPATSGTQARRQALRECLGPDLSDEELDALLAQAAQVARGGEAPEAPARTPQLTRRKGKPAASRAA